MPTLSRQVSLVESLGGRGQETGEWFQGISRHSVLFSTFVSAWANISQFLGLVAQLKRNWCSIKSSVFMVQTYP